MNTPSPVNSVPDPTTPGSAPAPSAAKAAVITAAAGTPAAALTVWLLQTYGHVTLDPVIATVVGSTGAAVFGYLSQVAAALLQLLQEKAINRV